MSFLLPCVLYACDLAFADWTSSVTHLIYLRFLCRLLLAARYQRRKRRHRPSWPKHHFGDYFSCIYYIIVFLPMHLSNLIFNLCDWLDCCCLHRIWHVACKNDVPLHMSAHFSNYISWHRTINAIHMYELPGKGGNTYRNTISFSQQDMQYYVNYEKWFIQRKKKDV